MAKKQSLKERLDALIDSLGSANKPTPLEIRNKLFPIAIEVEELENSQTLAEKDATIAALKEENENLNVALQTANAEIDRFRKEEKKREEKNADLPDDQFKILKALPSESDGFVGGKSIASHLGIDTGDVDVHLSQLRELGYAFNVGYQWQRTIDGNRHIMAKRLAGEEEAQEPKPHKHDDLSRPEQIVLVTMVVKAVTAPEIVERVARSLPGATLPMIQLLLIKLRGENMATESGGTWVISQEGLDYLWDRNLL